MERCLPDLAIMYLSLNHLVRILETVGVGLIALGAVNAIPSFGVLIGLFIWTFGSILSFLPQAKCYERFYPVSPDAKPVRPTGIWVTPETPLEVGTRVLAKMYGRWWPAQVIAIE